jgi:hypothetical protein
LWIAGDLDLAPPGKGSPVCLILPRVVADDLQHGSMLAGSALLLVTAGLARAHHISGFAYCDNGDGVIGAGDTPLDGVEVKVTSMTTNQSFFDLTGDAIPDAQIPGRYDVMLPIATDTYDVRLDGVGVPAGASVVVPASGNYTIKIITGNPATDHADPVNFLLKNCPRQGQPVCVESFNPAGKNIPPAGLTLPGTKGGQNPDGFYLVGSTDGSDVCVTNADGSAAFGPFDSGSTVKLTEAPGATPNEKPIGGPKSAVIDHITLDTDPLVCLFVSGDCSDQCVSCLLPPPPK